MVRWNKAYKKGTKDIVGIDDELSSKLEYVCMACGKDMIARRGEKRVHHFAHKESDISCDPEGFFHKLGKNIFKEIYDESLNFVINTCSRQLNLKLEYGECLIEKREEGKILKRNSDLYIKHLIDDNKDISVEVFFSHQVTKRKIDAGFRIIEIRLPISISKDENVESDKIEQDIRNVCTPPLYENDFVRFYNFEDDIAYQETFDSSNEYCLYNADNQDCLGMDGGRRNVPNFKDYISYDKKAKTKGSGSSINKSNENPKFTPSRDVNNKKRETSISGHLLQPRMEAIKPTIYFDVDTFIKIKYPNIRHQPAVMPGYKNIIDVIVEDGGKEYWLGIDYRKYEVLKGDLDRKIPDKWKEPVREYIKNLRPVDEVSK